jgi:hypothetical protein
LINREPVQAMMTTVERKSSYARKDFSHLRYVGLGAAMDDVRLYHIQIAGEVAESDLTAFCPLGTTVEPGDNASSVLTVRTDQSGLVGLIRHLHGLGFTLLAFQTL